MSLARYDWTLMSLNRELERALRHDSGAVALIPRVESREEAGRYVVRADLPGVAPSDIEITTEEGVLSLKALRRTANEETGTVTYQRRFALPDEADAEQITARSAHGVLEIAIGKLAKAQPRRITVEAA